MKKRRGARSERGKQGIWGSLCPTSSRSRGPFPRWLIVLLVIGGCVALYGTRYFQTSTDSGHQQDPHAAIGNDSAEDGTELPRTKHLSEEDSRLPSTQGPSWNELDDPTKDGWDTEVFAGKVKKQLETLGKLLADPGDLDAAAVANLITDDFVCGPLRPTNLATVFDDQHLKIERGLAAPSGRALRDEPPEGVELSYRGGTGLVEVLRDAKVLLSGATNLRFEVKVFRVIATPGKVSTRQKFAVSGRTKSGMLEQHATWDIGWATGDKGAKPRMRWLRVAEFEQAESRQPNGTVFADCTESVLGGNRSYADQFLRGMNHWFQRIQDRSQFVLLGNPGLTVGDVNGDGLDDLYVCQEAGLPNRLFIQKADGSARDESASWGVDWLQSSRSALLVDLDNDSDQDLVVAIQGGVVLAENDERGRFRLRDVLQTEDDTMSLSAVDYDMDGRLDIYVCAYYKQEWLESNHPDRMAGAARGFVVHDANNGAANRMFRNLISAESNWRFSDVTAELGLDANNRRYSLAASWDDFDNDGDPDVYVANDYGRDNLYRNELRKSAATEAGHVADTLFVDIADSAHVEDSATGMSITWGDYDRDGWVDVFVSNMWSSAGNRIAFQSKFRRGAPQEVRRRIQRLARGNTLLRNLGNGTFDDRSASANIEMGRWAWGSHFVDLNNDGWEDVIVSNGYITTEDTGDL